MQTYYCPIYLEKKYWCSRLKKIVHVILGLLYSSFIYPTIKIICYLTREAFTWELTDFY